MELCYLSRKHEHATVFRNHDSRHARPCIPIVRHAVMLFRANAYNKSDWALRDKCAVRYTCASVLRARIVDWCFCRGMMMKLFATFMQGYRKLKNKNKFNALYITVPIDLFKILQLLMYLEKLQKYSLIKNMNLLWRELRSKEHKKKPLTID